MAKTVDTTEAAPAPAAAIGLSPHARLERVRQELGKVREAIGVAEARIAAARQQERLGGIDRDWAATAAATAEKTHRAALGGVARAAAEVEILRDSHGEAAAQVALDHATQEAEKARAALEAAAERSRQTSERVAAAQVKLHEQIQAAQLEREEHQRLADHLGELLAAAMKVAAVTRLEELRAEMIVRQAALTAAKDALAETCRQVEQLHDDYPGSRLFDRNDYLAARKAAQQVLRPAVRDNTPYWAVQPHADNGRR